MAMPILQVLADGRTLEDSDALDEIVTRWRDWSTTAKDVGTQTRSVLSHLQPRRRRMPRSPAPSRCTTRRVAAPATDR